MDIKTAEIEQVSALVGELAAREISGLSTDALLGQNAAIARLERMVGALGSRYAGEIARRSAPELPGGGLARRAGKGNAESLLSHVRGGSVAGAKRSISAGGAFVPADAPAGWDGQVADVQGGTAPTSNLPAPRYPVVARASVAGELSVDAASLIVDGLDKVRDRMDAEALRQLEERLVARAVPMNAHEVRKMILRAVARVDHAELQRRERENHEARYLWWKQDHEGTVVIDRQMDAVTAAPILTVLEQMTTRDVRRQGRDEGETADTGTQDLRTVGQMRVDALHDLARHALGCTAMQRSGVRTSVVVRMSLADLMRGDGLGRIDGIDQPVSVREVRRLAGDAGIIPEVLAGDGTALDLGRAVRLFTPAQRLALLERDGGCAKCHAPPEHCEAHHLRWWEHGGGTDLANGVMLCTRCHHDVHRQGWEIEATATSVTFIPPPHLDPGRAPSPGGRAALDVEVPPPWPDLPPITPEDEAMVRAWEREHWAAETQLLEKVRS
ncbi:HNH endonuclease [Demequina activiva]|uniref:HNH nuclease domain-containing protein n=1 Tax=Demequina activiva TaxID=1582364 RepID=A0A919Q2D5_9MICO|nr:HNH endonuclease signature motif containing protein [Demequina activiva]GIG54601.1 hypothetical protein Dac01nite_13530 [Demequina activiva]